MSSSPVIVWFLVAACGLTAWGLAAVPLSKETPRPTSFPFGLTLIYRGGQALLGKMDRAGLPQLYRHSHNVFSGGQPAGDSAFETLAELGVRTVISVDGAEPNLDAAQKAGLRYVHLPIGYDGISRQRLIELFVAVEDLPGRIYIHCHRGLHRGPAAAVAVMNMQGWISEPTEADALLQELGTAPKYTGLYRDARSATPPTDAERTTIVAKELPCSAAVPPLAAQMVHLEHAWERWSARAKAEVEWNRSMVAEATTMAEILQEAGRLLEDSAERAALRKALLDDGQWLAAAVDQSAELPATVAKLLKQRCDRCHTQFRDH